MSRPMSDTAHHKAQLRALAHHLRRLMPAGAGEAGSIAACARLLALPELAEVRTVLGYAAMPAEIDPAPALAALRERGVLVAYPRVCADRVLTLHVIDDPSELVPGAFGILEPPERAPTTGPAELDAVIVPGVAFDAACARLGHGAGYYDRLLAALAPDVPLIALAFDEQIFGEVPREAHDIRMHVVVTPSAAYRRAD
ncbi:MAG: 5-formyltetrahydrofolate cyclo-ligase [Coriobacteriaceae bacterium]|nr:5-formyltetrahydrofolate cyclo-ligase [Coriobacteriaceae bacterium]